MEIFDKFVNIDSFETDLHRQVFIQNYQGISLPFSATNESEKKKGEEGEGKGGKGKELFIISLNSLSRVLIYIHRCYCLMIF